MPPPDAILEPTINVGPYGKAAWRQAGRTFGRTDTGYAEKGTFEGTVHEVESLAAAYDAAGALYEVTLLTGRRARLTVNLGSTLGFGGSGANTSENVWEMDAHEVQKDLLDADFRYGTLSQISKTERDIIQRAIDNRITLAEATAQISPSTTLSASATSLYELMKFGVRAYPVEATVIRHTQTVSNVWAAYASYNNVGRILSNSTMSTFEGAGSLFLFNLPTIPTATQFIESAGDLIYGWRKQRPRISRLSYNKWQITTTYQFGLWAVKLYGTLQ